MKDKKRKVEVVVISDVHLGTYGSKARQLHRYLKSIRPKILVINGDLIDIWRFSKNYWPKAHMQVVKRLFGLMADGTRVYYVTGNHDEMMRKFVGLKFGTCEIVNKVVLELKGQKAWFFHGDVFDVTMQHSKWLAQLGAVGYGMLIVLNRCVNFCSELMGRGKISLSKAIKDRVSSALKKKSEFEQTAADLAISKGYAYVICGHIHQPLIKEMANEHGKVCYLNSGDWVENMTALEYHKGDWSIYRHEDAEEADDEHEEPDLSTFDNQELFRQLMQEVRG
ncbi:UDP-2,3-diacylglucosamine pyrophosphatase LpxH [Catalinimonas alkaloidigena]|uniref:UDP-2,3-diacylglucosamine pyrophosphatase LpxH n=1 Tax=Catalinimonas alkaloidigena TaxID=1075417 RepID=A0A1G9EDU4_9BACT|nr:UDP-2,3-diacylglucosamine diphosphatase [Catalinimonas alkaloidigena]SDK74253.1 UDP-2,3-diacylglucosamine pyrophosphatase LpxH [Catalinimonas alkaloidigena]